MKSFSMHSGHAWIRPLMRLLHAFYGSLTSHMGWESVYGFYPRFKGFLCRAGSTLYTVRQGSPGHLLNPLSQDKVQPAAAPGSALSEVLARHSSYG